MEFLQNIWSMVQKELKQYFISPIAYVVMMIYLTISGYFFYTRLVYFSQKYTYMKNIVRMTANPEMLSHMNLNMEVIAPALYNMVFIFLFILPLIMMRSFAEESKQKTDELLMTSPMTLTQVVWGKFLGSFGFVSILVLPTVIYQALLFYFSGPEAGPVFSGYLGIFLFVGAGVAIGLFASSMTENQIIAAVVTFVILLFMFIINFLPVGEDSAIYAMIKYASVTEHLQNFLLGLIDTRDVVYFLSIIALFLFLTTKSCQSKGWR
ncbi:MAG: ABC transporter permease [Bdellovibrionota bacterium]